MADPTPERIDQLFRFVEGRIKAGEKTTRVSVKEAQFIGLSLSKADSELQSVLGDRTVRAEVRLTDFLEAIKTYQRGRTYDQNNVEREPGEDSDAGGPPSDPTEPDDRPTDLSGGEGYGDQ